MLWICLLVRILANPFSNVFQKLLTFQGVSPLTIVGASHGVLGLVCLPALYFGSMPRTPVFWGNMLLCAVLAAIANVLLVKAVQLTDLSVLGPVNAYKAVVSIGPGIVLLHETPTLAAMAGVGLIVAGSGFLVDRTAAPSGESVLWRFFTDRGIQYRIAALIFSAMEAVFLKRALTAGSPFVTFAVWSLLGLVLLTPAAIWRDARSRGNALTSKNLQVVLLLAATTGLMQLSTLVVFHRFPVAPALALFQMSTLVSVALGWRLFQEPNIRRRFIGSAIMAAGATIIVTNHA